MCVYKICPCKTKKSFQTSIEKYCALKITLFNDSQFRKDFNQVFLPKLGIKLFDNFFLSLAHVCKHLEKHYVLGLTTDFIS